MVDIVTTINKKGLTARIYQFLLDLVDDALDIVITLLTRKKRLERAGLPFGTRPVRKEKQEQHKFKKKLTGRLDSSISSKLTAVYNFRAAEMEMIEKCTLKHKGLRLRKNFSIENTEEILQKESVRAVGLKRIYLQTRLSDALASLAAYDALVEQVEAIRAEEYVVGNPVHEAKLLKLWHLLKPDDKISSCSGKHWTTIGFQSDEPSRDFRGMGILSLDQLIYLAKKEPKLMRSIMTLANHPRIGFPLAITGINITSLCYHLLKNGLLKNHFHNSLEESVQLSDFHNAYCRIFSLFADYWKKEDPPSIMSFNNVRMNFEKALIPQLKTESAHLGYTVV